MKLGKAIEILTQMGTPEFRGHTEDILAARKLGVEALIRERNNRINPGAYRDLLLSGETPPKPLHALGFNTGDDESP